MAIPYEGRAVLQVSCHRFSIVQELIGALAHFGVDVEKEFIVLFVRVLDDRLEFFGPGGMAESFVSSRAKSVFHSSSFFLLTIQNSGTVVCLNVWDPVRYGLSAIKVPDTAIEI